MPRLDSLRMDRPLHVEDTAFEFLGPFETFKIMNFEGVHSQISSKDPLLIVFVEARLVDEMGANSTTTANLLSRLERFNKDLRADGYDSRFLRVKMRDAPGHRDGEGVLALREFLQDTRKQHPTLSGAIFVGAFPEAMLVRRWIWRVPNATVQINGNQHTDTDFLWITPQAIAKRTDLVLADLTGNWQAIYQPGPIDVDEIRAIPSSSVPENWPLDGGLFISSDFEIQARQFEDFFYIRDDTFSHIPDPTPSNRLILQTSHTIGGPELAISDRAAANPIARPEIVISRINARNVALSPNPQITGTSGETLLDPRGKPQTIKTSYSVLPNAFQPDIDLERRLIIDYLDRNHQFRQGVTQLSSQYRVAAINGFPPNPTPPSPDYGADLANYLERAAQFIHAPIVAERANLLEFVQWAKKPALLKGITTHANSMGTQWNNSPYSVATLESETSGKPWRWAETPEPDGFRYSPSLLGQNEWSNFHLYRTIWENGTLAGQVSSHVLHTGCEVFSPSNAERQPYTSASYAERQEGEAWLFYMNAVTVTCRSKEFYDDPSEFGDALAEPDARLGDAWVRYFDVLADDASGAIFENTTRAKMSYWWGILGDWTLRLSFNPQIIRPFVPEELLVHPFEFPWLVLADNRTIVKAFDDAELAERALHIIRHYGLTERRTVGGDREVWEYYLMDGALPEGALEMETSIEIVPERIDVTESRSGWQIQSEHNVVATVGNEIDAHAIVEIIRAYGPTHLCWLGERDAPAMTYFRR